MRHSFTKHTQVIGLILALSLACAGADGAMGPVGPVGPQGITGERGIAGNDGKDGNAGVGSIGPQGIQGETGAAGVVGATGPKGDTGATGATGAAGSSGTIGNVIEGDLRVKGRVCVGDLDCLADDAAQIQVSGNAANISFRANVDGTWFQSPCQGYGSIGMSPDLGMRIQQNLRWEKYGGRLINFICPDKPTGIVGFDSQAEWSWNGQKPGRGSLGTQRLVLRTDEDNKLVYFALWAEGYKLGVKTSTVGCKWCENQSFIFPTQ